MRLIASRLTRFIIAGIANTAFGWLVYSTFIVAGAPPWQALLGSTLLGIGFNFLSIGGYAFKDLAMKRLPRFVSAYVFIYACNLTLIHLLRPHIGSDILTQAMLTPPVAICSFLLMSRAVFHSPDR